MLLVKTVYSHSASLQPGVEMGIGENVRKTQQNAGKGKGEGKLRRTSTSSRGIKIRRRDSHIRKTGVLVVAFRVLSQKHMTGDNVLF